MWQQRVWVFVCGCKQRVVCGRESVYGGFYVSEVSAFGDTVVVIGNCVLNGTNNFVLFQGRRYRQGRYSL
jgi:hypothetical protein